MSLVTAGDRVPRDRFAVCASAGVGKTLSARHYATWDRLEPILYDFAQELDRPPELVNWRTIVYTPAVLATPKRLLTEITALCAMLSGMIEEIVNPDRGFMLRKPASYRSVR